MAFRYCIKNWIVVVLRFPLLLMVPFRPMNMFFCWGNIFVINSQIPCSFLKQFHSLNLIFYCAFKERYLFRIIFRSKIIWLSNFCQLVRTCYSYLAINYFVTLWKQNRFFDPVVTHLLIDVAARHMNCSTVVVYIL